MYTGMHPEVASISMGTDTGLYYRYPKQETKAGFDPRTRDWYKNAMAKKGTAIITDPYLSAVTGEVIVTIAKATDDGSGVRHRHHARDRTDQERRVLRSDRQSGLHLDSGPK